MVWSRQDEPAAMTSRKGVGGSGGSKGQREGETLPTYPSYPPPGESERHRVLIGYPAT